MKYQSSYQLFSKRNPIVQYINPYRVFIASGGGGGKCKQNDLTEKTI